MNIRSLLIIAACALSPSLSAQNLYDGRQSVILEAAIQESPPQIQLTWVADTANLGYTVYRKFKDETSWGDTLANLSSTSTTWTDTSISVGIAYEYRLVKSMPHFVEYEGPIKGYGYIYAGIKVPPTHFRGDCLVVLDSSIASGIQTEIARLMDDLEGDGWNPQSILVDRNDPVTVVKAYIQTWAAIDAAHQKSLLLLGHVPVPYAGDIAPDGHIPDHKGAWPADGYYGNLDGVWTDSTVNVNQPPGTRNDNLPGDGKFDNRFFPSDVTIQVGRVDLWGMTKFPEPEDELLRRYLDKDHAWRTGQVPVVERGLIDNNFPQFAEGVCQAGWKNFAPMFGIQKVHDLAYRSSLMNGSYLWSFGAGGGGPESASDISNTSNYATDSLQTQFTFLFGSYFGDWDVPNNFLRAPLASRSGLTCTWGTRPNWQVHHMALGEHIGYSTRLTMNNVTLYNGGFAVKFVHIALMGDPTLRMHILQPVKDLTIQQAELHVRLEWQDPANALGYYIYKKTASDAAFNLVNSTPITGNSFMDSCAGEGLIRYMVRSVELRTSASGSYYNLSSGVSESILADPTPFQAQADFSLSTYFDQLSTVNSSLNTNTHLWDFGDGAIDTSLEPNHLYLQAGDYTVCLTATDVCQAVMHCQDITMVSSLPSSTASINDVLCHGDSSGAITLLLTGGTPLQSVQWTNWPNTGLVLAGIPGGSYTCTITSETGNSALFGPYLVGEPAPWNLQPMTVMATSGQSNGAASVDPLGGCQPYSFLWNNGNTTAAIQNLPPGIYCVSVTDCAGCVESTCLEVELNTGMRSLPDLIASNLYPNPAHNKLFLDIQFSSRQELRLRIRSMLGQLLSEDIVEGEHIHHQWDVSELPAGAYCLQIECQGRVSSSIWVKE